MRQRRRSSAVAWECCDWPRPSGAIAWMLPCPGDQCPFLHIARMVSIAKQPAGDHPPHPWRGPIEEDKTDHPTLDQLKTLRLDGMAEAFAEMQSQDGTADLTHAEWLGLLVDRESSSRETKRFESRMRAAKLRHGGAVPEDVAGGGWTKPCLLTGRWIKHKRNLMHWPLWRGQNLAGLCAGSSRLPRRDHRALQTYAASV